MYYGELCLSGAGTYKGCEVHGAWCERAAANNYARAVAHLLYRATPSYPAQGLQQVDRKNTFCRVCAAGGIIPPKRPKQCAQAEVISSDVVMEFGGLVRTRAGHHAHTPLIRELGGGRPAESFASQERRAH